MNKNGQNALKSILGDDILETLEKSDIYKPNTNTVLSPDEMKIGLQIVPKTIMNWLIGQLSHLEDKKNTAIDIPFDYRGKLSVLKHGPDNYSGEILLDNKRVCEFKNRSIPGIGLLILSTFELYEVQDFENLKESHKIKDTPEVEDKKDKLEEIIEQKLMLHRLVEDVVNQKLAQKDAIERLIKERLHSHIEMHRIKSEPKEGPKMPENKKSKLKAFLENRENKRQEEVSLDKSEIKCSDCDTSLYKNENKNEIKLCICYGEHMNKSIKFKKSSEGKVKFKFPKNFDIENIEMLLEDIKNK